MILWEDAKARSIKSLQQICQAVAADHNEAKPVLARLGMTGLHPSNTERDFHVRMAADLGIGLRVYNFEAPVMRNGRLSTHTFQALLPHEFFHHLFQWDEDMWMRTFFGSDPNGVEEFWYPLDHLLSL